MGKKVSKDPRSSGRGLFVVVITIALFVVSIKHFLPNAPLRCVIDKNEGRGLPAVLHRNDIVKLLQKLNLRGAGAELGVKVGPQLPLLAVEILMIF